jgi:hypothetical protein
MCNEVSKKPPVVYEIIEPQTFQTDRQTETDRQTDRSSIRQTDRQSDAWELVIVESSFLLRVPLT